MARNRSAAQLVRLAAMLPRTGQDPPGAGIPVDDKPNPFRDGTDDPVACLDRVCRALECVTGVPSPPGT